MPEHRTNPSFDRFATAVASSRPGAWFFVNVAPYMDRGLLKLTGGRFTLAGRHRVGFLKVKGAKSGAERTTPLVYTYDGDDLLLVASRGGDTKHPAWYRNVVANPQVRFSIEGNERSYRARELDGEERSRAWELVTRRYAGYAIYQQRTGGRRIPVIRLEPNGG